MLADAVNVQGLTHRGYQDCVAIFQTTQSYFPVHGKDKAKFSLVYGQVDVDLTNYYVLYPEIPGRIVKGLHQ